VTCVMPDCGRTGVWVGPKPVPRSGWRCVDHQTIRAVCCRYGCNEEFMAYPNSRNIYYCEQHFRKPRRRGGSAASNVGGAARAGVDGSLGSHPGYGSMGLSDGGGWQ